MSMILNTSITKLMKGYPTISDKYDVVGGILGGTEAVEVGTLLAYDSTLGVYVPAADDATNVAGVAVAGNVKLTDSWNGDGKTYVQPGEAVNCCIRGFVAVELDTAATPAVNAAVKLNAGKPSVATGTAISNFYFTGCVEGTLAEIEIRR